MSKKAENKNDDLFSDANEAQTNWFKFTKVGDRVSGVLVGKSDQPAKDIFQAQKVYELEQEDGTVLRVAIPVSKEGTIARANSARMGDTLGFLFEKEIPPAKAGLAPAKALKVFIQRAPEVVEGEGSDQAF